MSYNMPITCGSYYSPISPAQTYRPQAEPYTGTTQPTAETALPSGFPTGGSPTPLQPTTAIVPTSAGVPTSPQVPATLQSTMFTPGFLTTQIGKEMRVEFLIGTSGFTDRTGTLVAVGASYILIRPTGTDDLMLCDLFSIKFVTIMR